MAKMKRALIAHQERHLNDPKRSPYLFTCCIKSLPFNPTPGTYKCQRFPKNKEHGVLVFTAPGGKVFLTPKMI